MWVSRVGQTQKPFSTVVPTDRLESRPPSFCLQTSQPLWNSRVPHARGLRSPGRRWSSEAVIFGKGAHLLSFHPDGGNAKMTSIITFSSSKNDCLLVPYNHGSGCLKAGPQPGETRGPASAQGLPRRWYAVGIDLSTSRHVSTKHCKQLLKSWPNLTFGRWSPPLAERILREKQWS